MFRAKVALALAIFGVWATNAQANTQKVVLVNHSTLPNSEVEAVVPALQSSVDELAVWWNTPATIVFGTKPLAPGEITITLEDDSNIFGALGYHYVGKHNKRPYARVFVKTSEFADVSWTSVVSHELDEMLVNPYLGRREQVGKRLYMVEINDPVESDSYFIDGVEVSDFITPAWYRPWDPGPYDCLGVLSKPLSLSRGGYVTYWVNGHLYQDYGF